jgi:hypothetical protein
VFITQSPKGITFHTNIKSVQNIAGKQTRKINGVTRIKRRKNDGLKTEESKRENKKIYVQ